MFGSAAASFNQLRDRPHSFGCRLVLPPWISLLPTLLPMTLLLCLACIKSRSVTPSVPRSLGRWPFGCHRLTRSLRVFRLVVLPVLLILSGRRGIRDILLLLTPRSWFLTKIPTMTPALRPASRYATTPSLRCRYVVST